MAENSNPLSLFMIRGNPKKQKISTNCHAVVAALLLGIALKITKREIDLRLQE
jgi:hypothetical protein